MKQLSIVASAQINGIPNNVEAELRGAATPENIINKTDTLTRRLLCL